MQSKVTITNTGAAAVNDVTYRRVMDWDIETTPFNEAVSIGGWPATALKFTSDNGFASANPLTAAGTLIAPINANFPFGAFTDHGAIFDFDFGSLAVGESTTFTIFYGGADSEAQAMAALGVVGAEVFSLAIPNLDPMNDFFSVAIFAFKGVGGTPVDIPEPGAYVTFAVMAGSLGLGLLRARRSRKS